MPETANTPIDKVRQLQRQLWVCAKPSRTRRFHALYDRIWVARCGRLGVLVRYADDKEALRRIGSVMDRLGRTGNADREFNKMDGNVFRRIRRRQLRRGGQRASTRGWYRAIIRQ